MQLKCIAANRCKYCVNRPSCDEKLAVTLMWLIAFNSKCWIFQICLNEFRNYSNLLKFLYYVTPLAPLYEIFELTKSSLEHVLLHYFPTIFQLRNSWGDCPWELFEHSQQSKVFLIAMKKNWKDLDFVSSVGDMSGVVFSTFQFMLSSAGHQLLDLIFWLKVLLETRLKSKSFEHLIGFLASLVQKLWSKNKNWLSALELNKWLIIFLFLGRNNIMIK